jgi:hypothetical protein
MEPLFPRQSDPNQSLQTPSREDEALNSTVAQPGKVDLDDLPDRVAEHAENTSTPAKVGLSILIVAAFFMLVLAGLALAIYALYYYA